MRPASARRGSSHERTPAETLSVPSRFRITITDDISTIEICGSIKNIVACGAGFVDGLGLGDNTKAAVIRLGLKEMIAFADKYYPGAKLDTFFESCGVADLVTTCYGKQWRN